MKQYVPINRKRFDYESSVHTSLIDANNAVVDARLSSSRKFYGNAVLGFMGSFMSILFIGIFAMIIISLISPNTNITFKGFMQALSQVRFRNSWLSSLTSISAAWDNLINFKPNLPGGILNILALFTSFFQYIFNFGNVIYSILVGLFNLFMDFILNVLEILDFLSTLGAIIT